MKPNLMRSFSPVFKHVHLIAKVSLLSIVTIGGFQQVASASFAAIATGNGNIWGDSWNYPDSSQAQAAALQKCGDISCVTRIIVRNGCAAIARDPGSQSLSWGWAGSRADANANAINNCGNGACYIEVSDCTMKN
jgi:hypothetical protein